MSGASSNPLSLPSIVPDMRPPTVTPLFTTPPQISLPTYTIKQLVAYQPHMPSPPAGVSVAMLAIKLSHRTHYSSNWTHDYARINSGSLRPITNVPIFDFHALVNLMGLVKFDPQMALPWDASPMMSKVCVTSYLNVQVLGAAWQLVL